MWKAIVRYEPAIDGPELEPLRQFPNIISGEVWTISAYGHVLLYQISNFMYRNLTSLKDGEPALLMPTRRWRG